MQKKNTLNISYIILLSYALPYFVFSVIGLVPFLIESDFLSTNYEAHTGVERPYISELPQKMRLFVLTIICPLLLGLSFLFVTKKLSSATLNLKIFSFKTSPRVFFILYIILISVAILYVSKIFFVFEHASLLNILVDQELYIKTRFELFSTLKARYWIIPYVFIPILSGYLYLAEKRNLYRHINIWLTATCLILTFQKRYILIYLLSIVLLRIFKFKKVFSLGNLQIFGYIIFIFSILTYLPYISYKYNKNYIFGNISLQKEFRLNKEDFKSLNISNKKTFMKKFIYLFEIKIKEFKKPSPFYRNFNNSLLSYGEYISTFSHEKNIFINNKQIKSKKLDLVRLYKISLKNEVYLIESGINENYLHVFRGLFFRTAPLCAYYAEIFPNHLDYLGLSFSDYLPLPENNNLSKFMWEYLNGDFEKQHGASPVPFQYTAFAHGGLSFALLNSLIIGSLLGLMVVFAGLFKDPHFRAVLYLAPCIFGFYLSMDAFKEIFYSSYGIIWLYITIILIYGITALAKLLKENRHETSPAKS